VPGLRQAASGAPLLTVSNHGLAGSVGSEVKSGVHVLGATGYRFLYPPLHHHVADAHDEALR
jgi:hypothetical protein